MMRVSTKGEKKSKTDSSTEIHILVESPVCDQEGTASGESHSLHSISHPASAGLTLVTKSPLNTVWYGCNALQALLPTRSPPRTKLSVCRNRLYNETSCHCHIGADSIFTISLFLPFFLGGTIIAVWPIRRGTRSYLKALVGPSESATVWNQVSLQQPVGLCGDVAPLASRSQQCLGNAWQDS